MNYNSIRLKALLSAIGGGVIIFGGLYFALQKFVSADQYNQLTSISQSGNIIPRAALLKANSSINQEGDKYIFNLQGKENISFVIDTQDEKLKAGILKIDARINDQTLTILDGAMPYLRVNDKIVPLNQTQAVSQLKDSQIKDEGETKILKLDFTEKLGDNTLNRTVKLKPVGQCLSVTFESQGEGATTKFVTADNNYAGLKLGTSALSQNSKKIFIPYMPDVPIGLLNQRAFFTSFLDKTQSHGTKIDKLDDFYGQTSYSSLFSIYEPGEDKKTSNLREVAYLTLSSKIENTFPYPNNPNLNPKSTNPLLFLQDNTLGTKTAPADNQAQAGDEEGNCQNIPQAPNSENAAAEMPFALPGYSFNQYKFNNNNTYLAILKALGMDKVAFLGSTWGQLPRGDYIPKQFPVCERLGGEALYKKLITENNGSGNIYLDHEGYFAMAPKYLEPGGSSFDESYYQAACRDENGNIITYKPQKGETGGKCISSGALASVASPIVNTVLAKFNLPGTFLDTLTADNPERMMTYSQNNQTSRNLSQAIYNFKNFFYYLGQRFRGPVVGEGGKGWNRFDSYYAGFIDGVEREHDEHQEATIIPDFELKNVKPHSALNFGMGWHERWQCQGANLIQGQDSKEGQNCRAIFNNFDFDRYRAQTISFGHAALLPESMGMRLTGAEGKINLNRLLYVAVADYYLMQSLEAQYLSAPIAKIEYLKQGKQLGDLDQVLKTDPSYNFKNAELKLVYANGLTIFINNNQNPTSSWQVETPVGDFILPKNGFVAFNQTVKGWQDQGNFLAYSALVDGQRADYVSSLDYLYLNGRGADIQFNNELKTSGIIVNKAGGLRVKCDSFDAGCHPDSQTPTATPESPSPSVSATTPTTPTPSPTRTPKTSVPQTTPNNPPLITPTTTATPGMSPSPLPTGSVAPKYEDNYYPSYQPRYSPQVSTTENIVQPTVIGSESSKSPLIAIIAVISLGVAVLIYYLVRRRIGRTL